MIVDKIWNLTHEVHLTLTEWKPIFRIYLMRTTVGDLRTKFLSFSDDRSTAHIPCSFAQHSPDVIDRVEGVLGRGVEAELNAYARVQQVPLDTDPLMWWKQHVEEFPRLGRMARQYRLCLPLLRLLRDSSAVWGS